MRRPIFVLVFALACGLSAAAEAQQGGSAIRGRVTDEQKGVLPGASVVLTHQESGTVRETITGPDGSYLVQGLVEEAFGVVTLTVLDLRCLESSPADESPGRLPPQTWYDNPCDAFPDPPGHSFRLI